MANTFTTSLGSEWKKKDIIMSRNKNTKYVYFKF